MLKFNNLKKLSFDEIDNLLDYLTDGEEVLQEVILKSITVKTSKKIYYIESLNNSCGGTVYGILWDQWLFTFTLKNKKNSVWK